MAWYRKHDSHLCYLLIALEVAAEEGVVFTDTNATAHDHRRGVGIEGLSLIEFDAVRREPSLAYEHRKRGIQAEILVPYMIPLSQVREVVFVSEASLQEGRRLWGQDNHRPFRVAPEYFGENGDCTPAFAFVKRVRLLSQDQNPQSLMSHDTGDAVIEFRPDGWITATASVHVADDTQVGVCWTNGSHSSTLLTGRQDRLITDRVPMVDLCDGRDAVDFRLNGLQWIRREFTLQGGYAF